jgi:hypothetical protein
MKRGKHSVCEWRPRSGCDPGRAIASERGMALVMVLILSAICLAVMAALVYMITASTQVSGIQKRYKTALEAGKAGAAVTYELIGGRGILNMTGLSNFSVSNVQGTGTIDGVSVSQSCMTWKLNYSTSMWPLSCKRELSIDPDDATTYDMSFDLGTAAVYSVRSKIVDTVEGNSGGGAGLLKTGVVASNSGEVSVMSKPYLYTLEVAAENKDNRQERGKYEILYQY